MTDEIDYLIIGGGTAGCILAARLSEDPAAHVTLLEAGPEDRDPWIHIPAGYARLFLSGRYDWKFATEAEAELGGRAIAWPRGRVRQHQRARFPPGLAARLRPLGAVGRAGMVV